MITASGRPPLGERLTRSKVIAVSHVADLHPRSGVRRARRGGHSQPRLTLTTPGILDALPRLVDRDGASADVGVGTILTESDAERAVECGARFLVTPTVACRSSTSPCSARLRSSPAGLTPTELAAGWQAGSHRGQDLSRANGRPRSSQASARSIPRPEGRPVRRGRPRRQPAMAGCWRRRGERRRTAARRRPQWRQAGRAPRPLPSLPYGGWRRWVHDFGTDGVDVRRGSRRVRQCRRQSASRAQFTRFPVVQTSTSPSASRGWGYAPSGQACWERMLMRTIWQTSSIS